VEYGETTAELGVVDGLGYVGQRFEAMLSAAAR
jgi:hypothetical protein